MGSIDKLALVSRVLFEQRIIDQRKEIDALCLELFLRDFKRSKFMKRMSLANVIHKKCACSRCEGIFLTNLIIPEEAVHLAECILCPWMEEQIFKCGMVAVSKTGDHSAARGCLTSGLYSDSHFVIDYESGEFYFGERLWGATTTKSPELDKLLRLFGLMCRE